MHLFKTHFSEYKAGPGKPGESVVFFVFPVFPTMPARSLAFASLLMATGLNTVVGDLSADVATAYNSARGVNTPACAPVDTAAATHASDCSDSDLWSHLFTADLISAGFTQGSVHTKMSGPLGGEQKKWYKVTHAQATIAPSGSAHDDKPEKDEWGVKLQYCGGDGLNGPFDENSCVTTGVSFYEGGCATDGENGPEKIDGECPMIYSLSTALEKEEAANLIEDTLLETRTSGYCTDKSGWAWVGSQAECEEAATTLGYSDTTAQVGSYSGDPRGCWHNYGSPRFNTRTSSTTSCTTTRTCMCTLTAPACTNTDGSAPNSAAPCICGNAACTSDTGLFCESSSSTCSSSAN